MPRGLLAVVSSIRSSLAVSENYALISNFGNRMRAPEASPYADIWVVSTGAPIASNVSHMYGVLNIN